MEEEEEEGDTQLLAKDLDRYRGVKIYVLDWRGIDFISRNQLDDGT